MVNTLLLDRYAQKDVLGVITNGDIVAVKGMPRKYGKVTAINGDTYHVELFDNEGEIQVPRLFLERVVEHSWADIVNRVVDNILPESDALRQAMLQEKFVPGGRILAGAGLQNVTLYNCFVLPSPRDSLSGIFKTALDMAETMRQGGGVGLNVSSLRPRNAPIVKVNGSSSGAAAWMELYSVVTNLIQQAGARRGALMLILEVWHPDVLEFINVKRDMSRVTGANISVGLTDEFMRAVEENAEWRLFFPDTRHPLYDELWDGNIERWLSLDLPTVTYKTLPAREIWNQIINSAWASAEPGIWFKDRANELSNSGRDIIATNPCVTGDTWVFTNEGIERIQDLAKRGFASVQIAERMSRFFSVRRAKVFPTGIKPVFRLYTEHGYEIEATADHLFYTDKGWLALEMLKPGDTVMLFDRVARNTRKERPKEVGILLARLFKSLDNVERLRNIVRTVMGRSRSVMLGFITGMLDNLKPEHGALRVDMHDEEAAKDFQVLLLYLGVMSRRRGHIVSIEAEGASVLMALLRRANPFKKTPATYRTTVVRIEAVGEKPVYDLTEPMTHSFVGNGFVVHNCAEQPLPAWGVCNLGAINLSQVENDAELEHLARLGVRFLDAVIDKTPYPFKEQEERQKRERRIGLGTMGLAEYLINRQIRYGSDESIAEIERIYSVIINAAYDESIKLAEQYGTYLDAETIERIATLAPKHGVRQEIADKVRERGIRNVTLITQAPTGTTGTVMNTSTGIEPYFAFSWMRHSRLGSMIERARPLQKYIEEHGAHAPLPEYFVTAQELTPEEHVRVLAAIQKYTDSSCSKTCNVPHHWTPEQIGEIYLNAYRMGVKGITVYRDGSRTEQVLEVIKDIANEGSKCSLDNNECTVCNE